MEDVPEEVDIGTLQRLLSPEVMSLILQPIFQIVGNVPFHTVDDMWKVLNNNFQFGVLVRK